MSKKEIQNELKSRLDEFHVEIPEIPAKSSKLDRIANWIHTPAKNPLEVLSIRENSITQLVFYPLIFLLFLFFTPIFLI
ncbi:hypothetical protein [Bacillus sp. ISL-55]|uniref:hypothetical protein n=1 Tax=Bacillus sp. ISL-55 TaxID=2819134 RepID=UPI001BE6555D|nr:hypothetical protein [Bacillus sp. ISL-55]MBT2691746.1 hypothetical protein [Bacillus sp. ISL-55]